MYLLVKTQLVKLTANGVPAYTKGDGARTRSNSANSLEMYGNNCALSNCLSSSIDSSKLHCSLTSLGLDAGRTRLPLRSPVDKIP